MIVLGGFYKEFQFYVHPECLNLLLSLLSLRKEKEKKIKINKSFSLPKALILGWSKGERLHEEAVTGIGNVFVGTKIL